MNRTLLSGLPALALLAACATGVTLPPLPADHPASADAPTAPRPRPSGLLTEAAPLPAATPGVLADPHAGHDHGAPVAKEDPHAGHDHTAAPAAEEDPHAGHDHTAAPPPANVDAAPLYACPMHPEVRAGEPGRCPVCGMDLEARTPEGVDPPPEQDHGDHHDHHHGAPADADSGDGR